MLLASPCAAQTWTARMDSLARQLEREHTYPHGTSHAFAAQESWPPYDTASVRDESAYFNKGSRMEDSVQAQSARFVREHPEHGLTVVVERAQESISYGIFQIMGYNLRKMGFT